MDYPESSFQPGERVHHRCEEPDCPLFGTVVSASPDAVMATEDGRVYMGWAKVRWDALYKAGVTLLGRGIPEGYEQEMPFERLEPART